MYFTEAYEMRVKANGDVQTMSHCCSLARPEQGLSAYTADDRLRDFSFTHG